MIKVIKGEYNVQKNWKQASQANTWVDQHVDTVTPDVVSSDDLGIYSDEALLSRARAMENQRDAVINDYGDPTAWEVEIDYVVREGQIRQSRRAAHEQYVRMLEREYAEAERRLPAADIDNTNFLKFIGEIN